MAHRYKVKLAEDVKVLAVDRKSMADVKQGVFVGITAMPLPDGTQKAVEIHIFPEALRGTGEGHRPWDLMPNSTMTNANIESAVASSDGQELVLKYKDGEKKFIVPANVEVVMFALATVADLKPGEKIFVVAGKKQADGSILAPSIVSSAATASIRQCNCRRCNCGQPNWPCQPLGMPSIVG